MLKSGAYNSSQPAMTHELASLYATYALILFTVPTFGVAAGVGLLRLWMKTPPQDRLELSHFLYQKRTLMAAVVSILVGGILIIVGAGVFVLFFMAVWTIVRGTLGLRTLLKGRPIYNPKRLF